MTEWWKFLNKITCPSLRNKKNKFLKLSHQLPSEAQWFIRFILHFRLFISSILLPTSRCLVAFIIILAFLYSWACLVKSWLTFRMGAAQITLGNKTNSFRGDCTDKGFCSTFRHLYWFSIYPMNLFCASSFWYMHLIIYQSYITIYRIIIHWLVLTGCHLVSSCICSEVRESRSL